MFHRSPCRFQVIGRSHYPRNRFMRFEICINFTHIRDAIVRPTTAAKRPNPKSAAAFLCRSETAGLLSRKGAKRRTLNASPGRSTAPTNVHRPGKYLVSWYKNRKYHSGRGLYCAEKSISLPTAGGNRTARIRTTSTVNSVTSVISKK